MSKKITSALDLPPIEDNLPVVQKVILSIDNQVEDDFDFARENLYGIIEKSNQALEEMLDIAKQSQHPRSFEVLNNMMRTLADFNMNLIDIQKKKKDLLTKEENAGSKTVNNNLFVGTTADFTKLIEDARSKIDGQ